MVKICNFLRPVVPSLSDPNILFIALFSKATDRAISMIIAKPMNCITKRVVAEDKGRYQ
jgi:hypothetical protein